MIDGHKYSPGRRAVMQLSRAGYSKQQIATLQKGFIAVCPTPTDDLFIDFALSTDPGTIKEYLTGSYIAASWAPSSLVITHLTAIGYRSAFLRSHCAQLFRDHISTAPLIPIDLDEAFRSFVISHFPNTERTSEYGWYPSAYQLAELQYLGYSIEQIHNSLNIFRSKYISQISGATYTSAFFLFFTSENTAK
jgi:hypothetical protein